MMPSADQHVFVHNEAQMTRLVAKDIAIGRVVPDLAIRNAMPELLQRREPLARRIACDDGGVDCADRNARYPIRLDSGLVQCLVHASLVRAQRAAALENQRDAIAPRRPPSGPIRCR